MPYTTSHSSCIQCLSNFRMLHTMIRVKDLDKEENTKKVLLENLEKATGSGANDDYNGGSDLAIDEDFLNGFDDDDDGLIDEDFAAVGQQMFSCQYWDISEFTQESSGGVSR